jgi:hypothetical protein
MVRPPIFKTVMRPLDWHPWLEPTDWGPKLITNPAIRIPNRIQMIIDEPDLRRLSNMRQSFEGGAV